MCFKCLQSGIPVEHGGCTQVDTVTYQTWFPGWQKTENPALSIDDDPHGFTSRKERDQYLHKVNLTLCHRSDIWLSTQNNIISIHLFDIRGQRYSPLIIVIVYVCRDRVWRFRPWQQIGLRWSTTLVSPLNKHCLRVDSTADLTLWTGWARIFPVELFELHCRRRRPWSSRLAKGIAFSEMHHWVGSTAEFTLVQGGSGCDSRLKLSFLNSFYSYKRENTGLHNCLYRTCPAAAQDGRPLKSDTLYISLYISLIFMERHSGRHHNMELDWCQNWLFLESICWHHYGVAPNGTPYGVILTPWNLESRSCGSSGSWESIEKWYLMH
jgi:hypothetical protein